MTEAGNELKECVMMMGRVSTLTEDSVAIAIVIASSEKAACEYAEQVLKPYYSGYPQRIGFFILDSYILFPPITKTIFLYTKKDGQINEDIVGSCEIENGPGGCIHYPCCNPSNRGWHCKIVDCTKCNHRKCKPTASIDDVPCGRGHN